MLDLNNPQDFEKVSNDFDALALLFDTFAKNVSQQAKEAAITITLQSRPDTGHCPGFSTLFAGYEDEEGGFTECVTVDPLIEEMVKAKLPS